MSIFAIGIVYGLLLLGVCFLFVKRRKEKKRDWPSFLAMTSVFAALIFVVWLRQYLKFMDEHGLAYYISPTHGVAIITVLSVAAFIGLVCAVWIDRDL